MIQSTPSEEFARKRREAVRQAVVDRKRAYVECFVLNSPAVTKVLADLEHFCRGDESCFHQDPRMHAVLEGRREVFLRIKHHIDKTSEELFQKLAERKKL